MGAMVEGFASPLNCFFPYYCGAFVDVDAAFGSLGTFFGTEFVEGCIEINPPFVEEVMAAMADHIERQLVVAEGSKKPLCFIVVVPRLAHAANKMHRNDRKEQRRVLSTLDSVGAGSTLLLGAGFNTQMLSTYSTQYTTQWSTCFKAHKGELSGLRRRAWSPSCERCGPRLQ